MYESILLVISCNESSSLLKYLPLILFTGIGKKKNLELSQDILVVSCVMFARASFVSNHLWQNVSNAFKVTIETTLLREQ